jgi:hypothetical protein
MPVEAELAMGLLGSVFAISAIAAATIAAFVLVGAFAGILGGMIVKFYIFKYNNK